VGVKVRQQRAEEAEDEGDDGQDQERDQVRPLQPEPLVEPLPVAC